MERDMGKRYSQQELCDNIYKLLVSSGDKWLTRKEITEGIGRTKSPHILRMIEHLVSSGYAEKIERPFVGGYTIYFYRGVVRDGACSGAA